MVNQYLHDLSGGDFSVKDFRTWAGTLQALVALRQVGPCDTQADMSRKEVAMYDWVASQLGNTRTVCKKHYMHPLLVKLYVVNKLEADCLMYQPEEEDEIKGLSKDELVLLRILEKFG